ncbi:MAG TPA: sugar phosphate isomerase/epimerase [Chloroflexota bacterium]|nr:sugar phosphate isomerase/epimerase [Chloroflexota bacterium]
MAEFWLGCSQITWNRQGTPDDILAAIAKVGFAGVPAGYREGLTPEAVQKQLAAHDVRPAPGYLGGKYHDPAEKANLLELARRHADFSRALGCEQLFVAGNCFPERFAVAGHETANRADQLSDDGYKIMADTLNEVGRICQAQGVQACFHNHAGSYIETRDEFDKLLALTDPALVYIGLDTGHLAYGGGDVADFARAYAPRIKALHLKDVDPSVLARARRGKLSYHAAQDLGLWAELGEGSVDFPAMFASLGAADYRGWVIAEIDRTMLPTPEESIARSYRYLSGLKLSEETGDRR